MNFKNELDSNPIFEVVSKASQKLGLETYVVGGFVRDLIMNRPCKDIDFVCIGSGIQLANTVGKAFDAQVTVFKNFGTAMIKHHDFDLEFVGARKESYRNESRKPIVEDGTLSEDQQRRDFTINALAISLSPSHYGELIDPFEGVAHISQKLIKTPLDPVITFSDDPLRMMRAIRFAAQLNFDIDADTYEAIIKNTQRLSIVSMERIIDELNKIILSPVPSYGFKLLFQSGLLQQFFS